MSLPSFSHELTWCDHLIYVLSDPVIEFLFHRYTPTDVFISPQDNFQIIVGSNSAGIWDIALKERKKEKQSAIPTNLFIFFFFIVAILFF